MQSLMNLYKTCFSKISVTKLAKNCYWLTNPYFGETSQLKPRIHSIHLDPSVAIGDYHE
jgi:hypothetical protein